MRASSWGKSSLFGSLVLLGLMLFTAGSFLVGRGSLSGNRKLTGFASSSNSYLLIGAPSFYAKANQNLVVRSNCTIRSGKTTVYLWYGATPFLPKSIIGS